MKSVPFFVVLASLLAVPTAAILASLLGYLRNYNHRKRELLAKQRLQVGTGVPRDRPSVHDAINDIDQQIVEVRSATTNLKRVQQ